MDHPVEFHNVSAPEPLDKGIGSGWLLPRFPRDVREALDYDGGRFVAQDSAGVEIRFVTDATVCRVFLSGTCDDTEVYVYRGSMAHSNHKLQQGKVTSIHLTPPAMLGTVKREVLHAGGFSPDVWRIACDRMSVTYHGIEAFKNEVRPPAPEEKPRLRWLAYGSSITNSYFKGYPHQAACRLGVDVMNKGMSGTCLIEPAVAEYIATGCEWDFVTFELGVNMRHNFSPEEFEKRARHLVTRCLQAKPGRPIVLITTFPNFANFRPDDQAGLHKDTANDEAYSTILRGIASEHASAGVHLVEGSEILRDFSGLTTDLIHPSDFGHSMMGENLAVALRARLNLF